MKNSVNLQTAETFYQNLGKLFYAIAAADKVVRAEEVAALKEIVEKEWLKIDEINDEFGTDTAYQIEIIFDWLDENQPDAEEAFNDFKEYRRDHQNFFDPDIDKLIWKTADTIAASFAGKNKAEVIMLSKLKALLQ
ncbi:hypothetical protein FHG64_03650 [Antarcticibacterium flavum]|uniref:TerB family tellurite resistance protein n=1 Tax=Antarcticibacterium flavum TaxID=2058175 RepID=A0A5B7WZQ4_9FLAO|nr:MULTISPECIES: hypothetical protein [Antarcticibacterium]MCM4158706.1 hypothetical protein [Antarcticibacterium sp. W02-3]QCY68559.1 hypothetical protein FHG64_03650 [Antarcticibacterium flavum]